MTAERGMVIIGAGECGAHAAFALREEGFMGPITLVSEEAHEPYERPPLSKAFICDDRAEAKIVATRAALAGKHISLIGSTAAIAIDRAGHRVALSDGRQLRYERLLLATGAEPRRLVPAPAGSAFIYLRSLDDALALRRQIRSSESIVVIGGGFIGLEVAAAACRSGKQVSVIEAQQRILMRGVPAEIASAVRLLHEARGVNVITGQSIVSIATDGGRSRIRLSNGGSVSADLVIAGIGAVPRTGLAERAGLAINDGIAVDAELRSSDPDIFAAGDCCSFPLAIYGGRRVRLEAWRSAVDQSRVAARNMLGARERHNAMPWFWSDQFDWSLQIAGLIDEGAAIIRRVCGQDGFVLFHLASDGRLVAASAFGPGNTVARDIRVSEMLIAKELRPDPRLLVSAETKLKMLLSKTVRG